jgi:organic radical activating enzyme
MTELPSLVVSEIFGPTVSGEGASLGRRCGFLRLMGCNLHCSWCDTKYTWDASQYDLSEQGTRMTWAEIVDQLIAMDVDFVIISGGEPLLHQKQPAWELVLRSLAGAGIRVEVETNGTVIPNRASRDWVHRFTVSPKLMHAGDPQNARIVPEAIGAYQLLMNHPGEWKDRVIFKFVCATPDHVAEVQRLVKIFQIRPENVWVMPLGVDRDEIDHHLAMITDAAVAAGYNVTTRLHIQVWGNTRGH